VPGLEKPLFINCRQANRPKSLEVVLDDRQSQR
jgi:hypothetical protein